MPVELAFLGPPRFSVNQTPFMLKGDLQISLLAYLAVEPGPHVRADLATLLWPESTETTARNNLRQMLHRLRQNRDLGPQLLEIQRTTVLFHGSSATVDAHLFARTIQVMEKHYLHDEPISMELAGQLAQVVALYRGDFLHGVKEPSSPLYEEWRLLMTERFHRQALTALHRLATHYEGVGDLTSAIQTAHRAIGLEPWDEAAHTQLIHWLAMSGQRGAALHQFESAKRILDTELGVLPGQKLSRLAERLLSDAIHVARPAPTNPYRGLSAFTAVDSPHFFGRERFIEQLLQSLAAHRLAVLIGASGSGKSSLIHAGLIPRLLQNPDASDPSTSGANRTRWSIATLRPGLAADPGTGRRLPADHQSKRFGPKECGTCA